MHLSKLGIEHPIIQAPMGGGTSTPELAAAVSEAGGLGSLGAAYQTPAQIVADAAEVRRRTARPFAINLFAGVGQPAEQPLSPHDLQVLSRWHQELGLPALESPRSRPDPFAAQLEAVLEIRPAVFSFTFGIPGARDLAALHARDIFIMGTATTVEEAVLLEEAGVDAVVAQGSEAGAHRGSFAAPFEESMVGTIALVPQIVDAVELPVVASGGIMDGRGIAAARCLGAAMVQLGTAFLTCPESGAPPAHKAAVRAARDRSTRLTRALSGRPARGIPNQLIRELGEQAHLPFPLQNQATTALRKAAGLRGDSRAMTLWAGQAAALARELPAAELVRKLVQETASILQ